MIVDNLIYHFRLAENYTSKSIASGRTLQHIDSSPKSPTSNPRDYSFNVDTNYIVSASYSIILPSMASTFPSLIILILLSTTMSASCITDPSFDLDTRFPLSS